MTVYFVTDDSGHIKIGYTGADDVSSRVDALQCGNPRKLRIVCSVPGTLDDESSLKKAFSKARSGDGGTEWFYSSPVMFAIAGSPSTVDEILANLDSVLQLCGALQKFAYWIRWPVNVPFPDDIVQGRVGTHYALAKYWLRSAMFVSENPSLLEVESELSEALKADNSRPEGIITWAGLSDKERYQGLLLLQVRREFVEGLFPPSARTRLEARHWLNTCFAMRRNKPSFFG